MARRARRDGTGEVVGGAPAIRPYRKLGFVARLRRDARFLKGILRTLRRVRPVKPGSDRLFCDDIEEAVDKFGPRVAISFEGRQVTYAQLDSMANRYANWAVSRGIKRGDTVALFMPNRIEYVAIWYGLAKVGVATALINSNLAGAGLAHCLTISGAAHLIVDPETAPVFEAARDGVKRSITEWVVGASAEHPPLRQDRDLDRTLKGVSALRPTRETARAGLTAKDTALLIYTSGTTGLPKAARMAHMRVQLYMRGFAGATNSKPDDRIYCALPLYHSTGGLCGVGAALLNGGQLVLRKRFSARQFWPDVVASGATMVVYIGELCRYLVNQPVQPDERRHTLRLAFGNGLRGDVWEKMDERFAIPQILEFYGSTEGNVSMFNFDGKIGAVGRIPGYLKRRFNVRLVRFDVETEQPERDGRGRAVPCRPGEIGEAIGEIRSDDARASYTGYADKAATERKVLRNAFVQGDAWFRTGDLMRQDEEGYFYFVDRIGDTFRWKGENVSTGEVSERLSAIPGVLEANVYGVEVPGADGKAGMASLVTGDGFGVAEAQAAIDAGMPAYGRPIFLRLLAQAVETTGTFKYVKAEAVAEGYDPSHVRDPLYFREPGGDFTPLTPAVYAGLQAGAYKL